MEHKQEECKFDDDEHHNEQSVRSEPFVPYTAWTPEWKAEERADDDADG